HDVPTYSTLVKSTVTKLNIMGMVTADRVVANLTSTYRDEADAQPSIKLLGTRFENLRVAGHPVKVDLSVHVLDKYHQHRRLTDAYSKDKEVRELFGNDHVRQHYHKAPPEVARFLDQPPPEDGTEMPSGPVSLVHTLTPEGKGIECWGHVIYIEGFGTIRFGEVSLSPLTRSVAMIHVNLGCPVEGDLTICAIEDGGSSS
ncbi:MAG TPA: hypothetical protein VHB50_06780, partial [Bryobacteraceae bacterium]|nr:hypothetical protein [Bryobacteraceae bacterium]